MPDTAAIVSSDHAPTRRFSTRSVRPGERFAFWREAVCTEIVRLDVRQDTDAPFHAELSARSMARFDCLAVSGSGHRVGRSERLVNHDRSENLIVMHQSRGSCVAMTDTRTVTLKPGDVALLDSRKSYELKFPGDFSQTLLKVSVHEFERRLGQVDPVAACLLTNGTALGRLTAHAVEELAAEPRDSVAAPLADAAFDLLTLTLPACMPLASPRMTDLRISWAKSFIRRHLHEAELTPQRVADHQGVSLRLLQRAFAGQDESLTEFIVDQRLRRCESALINVRQAGRSITAIALDCGFSDPAHFSKAFRRKFGLSPTEWRRQGVRS